MKKLINVISLVIITILCVSMLTGCFPFVSTIGTNNQTKPQNPTINSNKSVFDGDCGVIASAEISKDIIGYPELEITITNTSDKDISAIQFYVVPNDVYGDEINSLLIDNKIFTDTTIAVGKTNTISHRLLDKSVKTVTLYIYSVYFSDGTEWGDRNSATSKILNSAPMIEVIVNS